MKLEEVSQVSIGILTSREVTEIGENEYKLFNLKNYDNQEKYEDVKTLKNFDDKLTRKGDLLIRLVYPNRIIYIDGEMENLLVPSQMCIIRVDPKKVDSQYLKWYLENERGKERIKHYRFKYSKDFSIRLKKIRSTNNCIREAKRHNRFSEFMEQTKANIRRNYQAKRSIIQYIY